MATQMPIDPEFDRNIEGMESMTENDDGSVEVPLELDDSQIEELPDGSAVVKMDDYKGPDEDEDFYDEDDDHTPFTQIPTRLPKHFIIPCDDPADGVIRFPSARFIEICHQVAHLFQGHTNPDGPLKIDRLAAAGRRFDAAYLTASSCSPSRSSR